MIASLNTIERLTELLKQAKLKRNTKLLEEVHNFILDSLQYLTSYKRNNRGSESHKISQEISQLETLNALVFKIYAQLEKSYLLRLRAINKNQSKKM